MAGSAGGEEQQRVFFAHGVGFFNFAEEIAGVSELGFKVGPDFLPYLVTAAMDSRPDGGLDVPRLGVEAAAHFTNTFLDDSFHGATPAGMEDSDGPALGVHEHDRKAVSGLDTEQESGSISDQAIADKLSLGRFRDTVDEIGMNLAQ